MRNEKLDFLRFVGLALIVLAHVDPPSLIFQLRNFDVPLMLLVSGVAFTLSAHSESYAEYVWKRVKRLVFPVWLFLTAFFTVKFLAGKFTDAIDVKIALSSYLLLSGIGFVWVIRVFLLVALLAPAINQFNRRIKSGYHYSACLLTVYAAYELMIYAAGVDHGFLVRLLLVQVVWYAVPYGLIFAIGLRMPTFSNKQILFMGIGFLVIFGIAAIVLYMKNGIPIQTQNFKYPPRLYYLSYAIGACAMLWLASDYILPLLKKTVMYDGMLFIARNSIWFYLWHILFIKGLQASPLYKYMAVFLMSGIMVALQVFFVRKVLLPQIKSAVVRKSLSDLLTG